MGTYFRAWDHGLGEVVELYAFGGAYCAGLGPDTLSELNAVFGTCASGLVFVSCFPDQATMKRYLTDISWETEVWTSDNPTHLVHFNGERFLGPYSD